MNTETYHGIKVYNGILEQLKSIHDTEQDSLNEVRHYANGFPREVDYNLAQYGNMLVYYDQIRDFYKECEYPRIELMETDELWEMYKKDVGYVANEVLRGNTNEFPMRMYKLEVHLPIHVTTLPIMEWIQSHKNEAERLDHTRFFTSYATTFGGAIVSVNRRRATLEDVLSFDKEPLDAFEYHGMRRYNTNFGFYFEIDHNVYYCSF